MKVLIVGGGGREHALAWKIARSPRVKALYCAPGNPGIGQVARCVKIKAENIDALLEFARAEAIDLTVVGPEDPLAAGIVDRFQQAGLRIFGPPAAAARLESDKAFAKEIMRKAAVPTAEARIFDGASEAIAYIESREIPPVVKAAGLAKGKGVFVCDTIDEAVEAVRQIMVENAFGEAGVKVLIEERLEGEEASILAFTDSRAIYVLESSQDHKAIGEGDTGPNTGGMGAYSPAPVVTPKIHRAIEREILVPIIDAMLREGIPYTGILYAGLMMTPQGPRVLEFNCRFGDPETQPLLMRMKSDIMDPLLAVCDGKLDRVKIAWDPRPAVCVVMASGGYPGSYEKGKPIAGLSEAGKLPGVQVFHAGTASADGEVVTSGGRVLGVTALGRDIRDAQRNAYAAVEKISFDGAVYRKDIAWRALG